MRALCEWLCRQCSNGIVQKACPLRYRPYSALFLRAESAGAEIPRSVGTAHMMSGGVWQYKERPAWYEQVWPKIKRTRRQNSSVCSCVKPIAVTMLARYGRTRLTSASFLFISATRTLLTYVGMCLLHRIYIFVYLSKIEPQSNETQSSMLLLLSQLAIICSTVGDCA